MNFGLLLTTDGEVKACSLDDNKSMLQNAYDLIGCSMVECPFFKNLATGYVALVDEEGLFAEEVKVNPIASWLYGMADHGQPIVGNVLILRDEIDEEGEPVFAGMTKEDADSLAATMLFIKGGVLGGVI